MLFEYSEKTRNLIDRLQAFVDANILPVDHEVHAWNRDPANLWKPWPGIEPLKKSQSRRPMEAVDPVVANGPAQSRGFVLARDGSCRRC